MEGERSEERAAALAAIGACVGVGIQELLDFGMTIPANSVTLAVVCGAALAVPRQPPGGGPPQPGNESVEEVDGELEPERDRSATAPDELERAPAPR